MGIGAIGTTGVDVSQYSSRQTEAQTIQQASQEQQAEKAVTVQAGENADASSQTEVSQYSSESAAYDLSAVVSESVDTNTVLVSKANSGAELSRSELAELEDLDPALAAQVKRAQSAREQLRQEMQANPAAAGKVAHEAVSQHGEEEMQIVRQALSNEYLQFAQKYDQVDFGSRY